MKTKKLELRDGEDLELGEFYIIFHEKMLSIFNVGSKEVLDVHVYSDGHVHIHKGKTDDKTK